MGLGSDLNSSFKHFGLGAIKFGAEECNAINQCIGDQLVFKPFPVYSDVLTTNMVGHFSSIQTVMDISDDNYVSLGTFAIQFNDQKGSELVFSGEQDLAEHLEGVGPGDFPIIGGVGDYL